MAGRPKQAARCFDTKVLPTVRDFLDRDHLLLIDGKWAPAADGTTFVTSNPADGRPLATVACAGRADIDEAARAARRAFAGPWSRMSGSERSKLLWRIADLIMEHADELAQLETLDQGKPLQVARNGDIPVCAETFRYMAGWATKLTGDTIPIGTPGQFHGYTVREPVGVAGQIVPWNFPLAMAAWKLAPALAAGCTVILKPAENTPLSTLRLGELLMAAGVPPGVVNIVPGFGNVAGARIAEHPEIDKIAFTGSTAVGKAIVAAAAGNLKRVSLELGGKNPAIVLPDADLAKAIPGILQGAFANCGQVCTAPSRILVHRKLIDKVAEGIVVGAEAIRVGPGLEEGTEMGPVVSDVQMNAILEHVKGALSEGAEVATGGSRIGKEGYFIKPTVILKSSPGMRINREEVFGPVVTLLSYDDTAEAVEIANATQYGLTAQVWTQSMASAEALSRQLEFGSVWINGKSMDIALPFGGFKQSGWGLEKGAEGIDAYTRTRTVVYAFQ